MDLFLIQNVRMASQSTYLSLPALASFLFPADSGPLRSTGLVVSTPKHIKLTSAATTHFDY